MAATKEQFGRRLVPHVIDDIAQTEPTRECFAIPRSNNPQDGWKPVSFKQYANAINHVAHRIIEICGHPPANTFPTIAYIGPNDARYVVMVVAALKAGYKALLISPRNSQEGQMSLFDKTDCRVLAFPASHRKMVQPWLQEREMQAVEVGPMEKWFVEHDVTPFPYTKTFAQAEWEPLVVLHTSGSTGIPKPIVCRQGMMAIGDAHRNLPEWEGKRPFIYEWAQRSKRSFDPMPLFHAAGMYLFLITAIYYGTPIALGVVDRPLSSDLVAECLKYADVEGAMLPPAILEDMSQSDQHIEQLKKLKMAVFGGGNLAKDAGNRMVKQGVRLVNAIGSTEFFPFPFYWQPNPDLWQYFVFNSDIFGADWRKMEGEDDVYQLVIVRKNQHPGLQGLFYTFPDDKEWDTKDLYKPHPTLPDHWIYYGRSDNIIVFSNGEKLNPVTIEEIVMDHPQIQGAVVVGAQRFQPGLILEPTEPPKDESEAQKLIDSVWPHVVRANKETVAHGQIGKDFIILSNLEKPFHRAGKGTIQRASTLKLYRDEIDQLYKKAGELSSEAAPRMDISSEQTLIDSIEEMFQTRLGAPEDLNPDTDFFSAGIDSMQVINASRLLRAGLEAAGCRVDATAMATRVIYGNPTPRRLASYINSVIREGTKSSPESEEQHELQSMKALWKKYTSDLPKAIEGRPAPADEGQTVIMTGSTGMLGSYMLDLMVKNRNVKKIICLNRAEDGGAKQQAKAMKERGLASEYASKCTLLHADMSRSDFGLPRDTFNELLKTADRIIHNAWPVNFNIPTESFAPHLRGVRNVADFATNAAKRVAVVFISSIGTGDRWPTEKGPVPEARLEDLELPGGGYGRSKMIGSLILEDVAKSGDFPAAIIRVGQIAGPEGEAGFWNKQEWLPSIIASSLYLKALPRNLGQMERVDWTPCERIASLVLEVAGVSQKVAPKDISGYFHGVNPKSTTWTELAPAVQQFYGKDRIRELVSFQDWVKKLEESQAADTSSLDKNPGVKLIDSYRGMASADENEPVVFDMTRTTQRSAAMRTAEAVTPKLMQHFCKQWGF
ncbi:Uu.00g055260.m01.CDS01 [Anthostomella pinea]|uniref:Uu.00g055260.m01.CDS01 n=1 Tax=Anthostomella pinea TaxID=933095 RepID=A0AAI8VWT0_9PEZI|nr:Uu.00g055260.m01.CDS01 [Anthostomella pinea]